jgi:hypothetical protein
MPFLWRDTDPRLGLATRTRDSDSAHVRIAPRGRRRGRTAAFRVARSPKSPEIASLAARPLADYAIPGDFEFGGFGGYRDIGCEYDVNIFI